jgi:hypothetical protein
MSNDEKMTKFENARDYESLFWNDGATFIVCEEPDEKRVYDLEERTARFCEAIIDFAKTIPQSAVTYRIIGQLVGAASSVGANYVEADDAVSKKRILEKHRHLPKRSARDETLPSDGRSCRPGIEATSAKAPDGSEGIAPHFLENLEEREVMSFLRGSAFFRHSSFDIRHFLYA